MSVIFNEENKEGEYIHTTHKYKGIAGLLIRKGLCKTERSANMLLLVIALCIFLSSVLLLKVNEKPEPPQGFQKVRME